MLRSFLNLFRSLIRFGSRQTLSAFFQMTKTQLVLVTAFACSDLLFIRLVTFGPFTPIGQIGQLLYVFLTIFTKLNEIEMIND